MTHEHAQLLATDIRVLVPNNLNVAYDDVEVSHSPVEGSDEKVVIIWLDGGPKLKGRFVMVSQFDMPENTYAVGFHLPDGRVFVTQAEGWQGEFREVLTAVKLLAKGVIEVTA